jgi:hypothetical protein
MRSPERFTAHTCPIEFSATTGYCILQGDGVLPTLRHRRIKPTRGVARRGVAQTAQEVGVGRNAAGPEHRLGQNRGDLIAMRLDQTKRALEIVRGSRPHIRWTCCAAHFGVSFNSLLVGGVFAVTAEPPLSVNT